MCSRKHKLQKCKMILKFGSNISYNPLNFILGVALQTWPAFCFVLNLALFIKPDSRRASHGFAGHRWDCTNFQLASISILSVYGAEVLPWRILDVTLYSSKLIKFYSSWVYFENSTVYLILFPIPVFPRFVKARSRSAMLKCKAQGK